MGCLGWGRRYSRLLEENKALHIRIDSLDEANEALEDTLRRAQDKIEHLE